MFQYVRKNGIVKTLKVIWRFKLQRLLTKICKKVLKKKELKNIIVIESHNDFDCNGGVFYDYLIKNGFNQKYKIVWLLHHKLKKKLPKNVTACRLFKPSIRLAYYNCVAKYFFFDNDVLNKVREGQVSIFCGHGAFSLKNVQGKITLPDDLDYILSPSKNLDEIQARQLSIGYPNNKQVHLGFPCHDILFQPSTDEVSKVTKENFTKKILWMPTFRKAFSGERNDSNIELPLGIPLINSYEEFKALNEHLKQKNFLLIIKLHPKQDLSNMPKDDFSNIKILTGITVKRLGIDNYRLMRDCDAALGDYSSATSDFLLLNRPIGYIMTDLKEYKIGLIAENVDQFVCGDMINLLSDLFKFIDDLSDGRDKYFSKRLDFYNCWFENDNGNSCRNIVEFLQL